MANKRPQSQTSKSTPERADGELTGPLGFMARNPKILGWFNLVAAILLFYFALNGFLGGLVFLPFGFGLMGLYFFYGYVRNALRVDFGAVTLPLNLVLLLSALVCLVIGVSNKS